MSAYPDSVDPSANPSRSAPALPLVDVAVVALLWLVYLLPFTQAMPFIDGVRDMQFALDIARGDAFPLIGPVFGNRFHLGPVFYYLQALPLLVGLPMAAVSYFLGVLAGAKLALAYGFGRDWIDRRYGLLFAAALALPGWSGMDFLNLTTPLLVPSLLLISCWCALRFVRGGRASAMLGCALAISLAIHAHPSAAVVGWVAVAACAWRVARERRWGLLAAAVGVGLLPLLPAMVAVVQSGPGAVLSDALTVTVPGSGHSFRGWLDAVHGFALGGPLTSLRTLGSANFGAALAWITFGVTLAGLLLLLMRVSDDRRALALATLLLGVGVVVFAARVNTPWYFVHALTLTCAAATAYGWHRWRQGLRFWIAAAAILASSQGLLVHAHLARGEGNFASIELMDIRRAKGERGAALSPWISVDHWSELAELLCADPARTLALHGALARAVDDQGALSARARCDPGHVQLGGDADRHWVGLPRALWSALQWSPQGKIGSIGLFSAVSVISTHGHRIADPRRYPLRAGLGGDPASSVLTFTTTGDALLLVGQLSPALAHWQVNEVRADGVPIQPIYADSSLHGYHVDRAENVHWSLRVSASALEWVDIVVVAPQHSSP